MPIIEPELIQNAQLEAEVEAEVLPPVAASTAVPAVAPSGEAAEDWKAVVALSAAIAMICSVDRAAMSVALGPMGDIFSWSDTTKGAISSSFFLGYTFTNLVGALLRQSLRTGCQRSMSVDVATIVLLRLSGPIVAASYLYICDLVCSMSELMVDLHLHDDVT